MMLSKEEHKLSGLKNMKNTYPNTIRVGAGITVEEKDKIGKLVTSTGMCSLGRMMILKHTREISFSIPYQLCPMPSHSNKSSDKLIQSCETGIGKVA